MAHVLIVVSRRYNPGEFLGSIKVLKQRGHTFDIVSSSLVITSEVKHTPNKLSRVIDEVQSMDGYDGLIIISGNPSDTEIYWNHPVCQKLVVEANAQGLIIAAVCSAVPAIRRAAKGKTVSVYPLLKSIALLEDAGAIISKTSLSTDGNVVTAENEQMNSMWMTNVCDVLEGKPPTYVLHESPFKRKLPKRPTDPDVQRLIDVAERTGKHGLE